MKLSLDFHFQSSASIVFEHMIHYKNFEEWNPIEGIYNIVDIENDGKYSGFSATFDLDEKIAKSDCESLLYTKNREVRYRLISCKFEDGSDAGKGWSFPFSQMYQRLCFKEDTGACIVTHEIILESKNWLGWITCKLFVLPQLVSTLKESNWALNEYLARL